MSLCERFGYTVLATWRVPDMELEAQLRRIFRKYRISLVIDVGANAGQYRDFLRQRVGFDGIIHSFEPLPELAAAMRARAAGDPAWHVHQHALGVEEKVLKFNVMAHTTFSSFRAPDESYREFAQSNRVVRTVDLNVKRLDDVAPTLDGMAGAGVFVKIDTQGFDMEVIAGAQAVLAQAKGLQFELAMQHIYKDVPSHIEMLGTVQRLGFDVAGMYPISRDDHLRVVELDCVTVRASTLADKPPSPR